MMANKPYDDPSKVTVEAGEVQIDGPDGVAVSMTPAAALETAERLFEASMLAHGQTLLKNGERLD